VGDIIIAVCGALYCYYKPISTLVAFMMVQIQYRKSQFFILSAMGIDRGTSNFNIQTSDVTNAKCRMPNGIGLGCV